MAELGIKDPVSRPLETVRFQLASARVPQAKWIALVGSFNRWDPATHRMSLEPDGWSISVMLVPGTYPYLFIVDGYPYNDPEDDGRYPCEWGGSYSLRVVR